MAGLSNFECLYTGETYAVLDCGYKTLIHEPSYEVGKFKQSVGIDIIKKYAREEYGKHGAYSVVEFNPGCNMVGVEETFCVTAEDTREESLGDLAQVATLDTAVNIEDADSFQQDLYDEMADIFEERYETFVNKNLDYGSSFLTAGKVDLVLGDSDGPFDSAEKANLYKLFTRIQDKDQRFYTGAFTDSGGNVDESLAETAGDAAVYWLMVEWLCRRGGDE